MPPHQRRDHADQRQTVRKHRFLQWRRGLCRQRLRDRQRRYRFLEHGHAEQRRRDLRRQRHGNRQRRHHFREHGYTGQRRRDLRGPGHGELYRRQYQRRQQRGQRRGDLCRVGHCQCLRVHHRKYRFQRWRHRRRRYRCTAELLRKRRGLQ